MAKSNRARKVRCIETGEVYNSYSEAGKAIGVTAPSIRRVVIGEQESIKGLHFEAVEEEEQMITSITNEQKEEVLTTTVTNSQGETIPVIDSREVARMMGREHWEILYYIDGSNDITGILPTLLTKELGSIDYFIESSYRDAMNRKCKCYLCTRMGCDLLATRQRGEKGILFCAKYVKRFKEMEEELKSKSEHQHPELAKEDELILAMVKGATPLDRAKAVQEYTALITDKATAPLKAELTQTKSELTEKTEFIDDINDCFTFTEVKEYNKQLLRDRKDIVLSTAELNKKAAELNIPINKIDNPIEYSPYKRVNAYPRKVWEKAYPDIKLPEKKSKKLPEKESKKLPEKENK